MITGSISKRYARALMELAQQDGQIDQVQQELHVFVDAMNGCSELHTVLTSPSFLAEQRILVLKQVLDKLQSGSLTRRFLLLLTERKRMDILPDIVHEFSNHYDELRGHVRVTVTSAQPLTAEQEQALIANIERATGRKAVVSRQVDPHLIGGVVTRVNDLLIDGSVATQLKRMRSALLQ